MSRLLLLEDDLLLLDVTLPDGTGFMICDEVRASGDMIPIVFLTAADEETSIIRGLDSGGDDYITKPFKLGELCSRIRALLRRSTLQSSPIQAQYAPARLRSIRQRQKHIWMGNIWILPERNTVF